MKNGISVKYASEKAPSTSLQWKNISEKERIASIQLIINDLTGGDAIKVINAFSDGQVIISLNNNMNASERGFFLLNFEDLIKKILDNGISVWHEAIGDKNSLRNLRGIELIAIEEDL